MKHSTFLGEFASSCMAVPLRNNLRGDAGRVQPLSPRVQQSLTQTSGMHFTSFFCLSYVLAMKKRPGQAQLTS